MGTVPERVLLLTQDVGFTLLPYPKHFKKHSDTMGMDMAEPATTPSSEQTGKRRRVMDPLKHSEPSNYDSAVEFHMHISSDRSNI